MRRVSYKATIRIENVEIDIKGEFDSDDDKNDRVGLATEHLFNRITLPVLCVTDKQLDEANDD